MTFENQEAVADLVQVLYVQEFPKRPQSLLSSLLD